MDVKINLYSSEITTGVDVSFVDTGIKAGFPSPAQDYLTGSIDLNKELIRHKETTFLAKVSGTSLQDAGICDGDIIVVNKSLEAKTGDFVVAFIDGEFTVKRIKIEKGFIWLIAENKDYQPIKVTKDNEFLIWGIVINVIKYF